MTGLGVNPYFGFSNNVQCGQTGRGRSVLAFRFAPLLSPPRPATAYALALAAMGLDKLGLQEIEERREMNLGYPIKHWLTSLIIGPTIMIIYDTIDNSKLMIDAVGVYFLFVTFGLFFSLPTFILYALTYNSIIKTNKSNLTIKTILNILGILGIVVTFSLIKGTLTMKASIFYSTALMIASLCFKVRPKEIKQTIDG